MVARLKVEGMDGWAPPGVEPAALFDSTRENFTGCDIARIDRLIALSRGAWPFFAGGII